MSGLLSHIGLLLGAAPMTYQTVLQLDFEGANGSTTFTEATGKTPTVTSPAQISTAWSYAGSSSGLFNGSTAKLAFASSADFNFSGGKHMRGRAAIKWSSTGEGEIVAHRDAGDNSNFWFVRHQADHTIRYYARSLAQGIIHDIRSVAAASSSGSLIEWGVDPVTGLPYLRVDSDDDIVDVESHAYAYAMPSVNLYVGAGDASSSYFPGHIDHLLLERLVP